ncbi:MAG TPA: sigma-70 domain-containing protein [Polyangiaceae bacterium]|nr:sigma-70 domain-containing protein [Polyangiaceae bacterium]
MASSEPLKPALAQVARSLLAEASHVLSLDVIAERLATLAVDTDEIEQLFDYLEAHGKTVGDPGVGAASETLGAVLTAARSLKRELGRAPNSREIAEHAALPIDAVRRALLFAKIVQR